MLLSIANFVKSYRELASQPSMSPWTAVNRAVKEFLSRAPSVTSWSRTSRACVIPYEISVVFNQAAHRLAQLTVDMARSEEESGFLQKFTQIRVAVHVVQIGTPARAASKHDSNRGHVAMACAQLSVV